MPLLVTHTSQGGVSPASCRLVGRKRCCTWFWSAAAPIVATWQAVEAGSAGFCCFLVPGKFARKEVLEIIHRNEGKVRVMDVQNLNYCV